MGAIINQEQINGLIFNGDVIYRGKPPLKIVDFATGSEEEIAKMLDAHYQGKINIGDHWHVGDTRVMHLSAMTSGTGASESHVAQNMTFVIIGINHDTLKEQIGVRDKAAITLQCKELLGNNGSAENTYIFGSNTATTSDSNYSKNPRRTWLNNTFVGALPSVIQPLVKTVVKKNLANHTNNTIGPDTEDKAFLTSYPEMFGNVAYTYYISNKTPNNEEGEQYSYYDSKERRKKLWNNNGTASSTGLYYWLRSPGTNNSYAWMLVSTGGSAGYESSGVVAGLAPAFCL